MSLIEKWRMLTQTSAGRQELRTYSTILTELVKEMDKNDTDTSSDYSESQFENVTNDSALDDQKDDTENSDKNEKDEIEQTEKEENEKGEIEQTDKEDTHRSLNNEDSLDNEFESGDLDNINFCLNKSFTELSDPIPHLSSPVRHPSAGNTPAASPATPAINWNRLDGSISRTPRSSTPKGPVASPSYSPSAASQSTPSSPAEVPLFESHPRFRKYLHLLDSETKEKFDIKRVDCLIKPSPMKKRLFTEDTDIGELYTSQNDQPIKRTRLTLCLNTDVKITCTLGEDSTKEICISQK